METVVCLSLQAFVFHFDLAPEFCGQINNDCWFKCHQHLFFVFVFFFFYYKARSFSGVTLLKVVNEGKTYESNLTFKMWLNRVNRF